MSDDRLAVAFLGTFESLRMGPTFARGRRDERAGHVRSLTISSSLVVAQVRGPDDPRAFRSRIAVRAFGASEWAALEETMAREARYAASLLGGRMPDGIADVFAAAGLSLVPLSLDEVAMDCSCERWPMPCVHLAATCYAVARRFQENPFDAFTWRGRGRDELLLHLRELRSAQAVASAAAAGSSPSGSPPGSSSRSGSPRGSSPSASSSPGSSASGPSSSGLVPSGSSSSGRAPSGSSSSGPTSSESSSSGAASSGSSSSGLASSGSSPSAPGVGPSNSAAESEAGSSAGSGPESGSDFGAGPGSSAGPWEESFDESELGESLGEADHFWGSSLPAAVPVGGRPGHVSRPDALLDQLDPPPLADNGRPIVEVLRPAYRALPDE